MEHPTLQPIACIHSDFPTKFGIPKQSGIVPELRATIVFEPAFRVPEACRGIEDFSHLWLLWGFSAAQQKTWSPTVRPPILGGNRRMGIFATRSPFRPNSIGLSSVKLEGVEQHHQLGTVLHVCGADLMDGSPIYDIKPYLAYTDCHPDATGGFSAQNQWRKLSVHIPSQLEARIPPQHRKALQTILENDPRPPYQDEAGRIYGMPYANLEIKFTVTEGMLTVQSVEQLK